MEKEQLVSLVTKAQAGETQALNCLFNEFYNDLYYFALKTVKDDETALDVTQEAFVEIINTLGNLKEPAAFVTWAKQITYHQCTRYFKKKKDVLVDEDEEGNTVFDTLKEEKAEFIPDEALDKADFKKTVMGILDELSEEQRSAVMMYYFDEMSVKQIAEIQGVSEGTVKSRLNYARKAIKNSVEEYEKKHNIKLHAIPFFPFLKWIFDGMFEGSLPTASAEIIAEGVGAATGTTVTVATATTTATTVATTTTAGAVGIGAKIAAMPIVTKVIAGVVAAAIVIGGGTTAVLLSQKDNTPTSADSQIDYSYRTEYMTSWNYEQALNYYHGWLNDFDMPYFNSVDEVSVDVAVRFGYSEWAGTYQGEWDMESIVGDQKALLKAFFGREFDFTKLTGEYATYNAEKGIITINKDTTNIYNADSWRSDTGKPIDNGDGTYSIIIRDYRNKVNTLPDDIKDGEYVDDEENGGYFLLTHSGRLTIEKKDGFWVLKSYTKADSQSNDSSSSETTTSEGSSSNNTDTTEETKDDTTSKTNTELVLEGTIPEGCTYTLYDGTVLTAGQKFPETCTAGDKVSYGDYLYGYECLYAKNIEGTDTWHMWKDGFDSGDSGVIESDVFGSWSIMVADQTKSSYGAIVSKINGKPIKTLYGTFFGCTNMTEAPKIPSTITAMPSAYWGCSSLVKAPTIPANVERIMMSFKDCTSLTGDVIINAKLDKSLEWYYSETFSGTVNNINLTGSTPEEDLILIAKLSDNKNITVNGKSIADDNN